MLHHQLSGVFSGLLAAAIQNMDGIGGRPGWAWIFILVCTPLFSSSCFVLAFFFLSLVSIAHSHSQQEGLFSFLVGVTSFFLVPSTPRDSKFLTLHEKQLIQERLELDRPAVTPNAPSDKFSFREILNSLTSIHVILVFISLFMLGTILYGLALFSPSTINQMGFSPVKSQLLSVGPFAAGFFRRYFFSLTCFLLSSNFLLFSLIVTLLSAYFSDKYQNRSIPTILVVLLCVIGFSMNLRKSTIRNTLSLRTWSKFSLSESVSELVPIHMIIC